MAPQAVGGLCGVGVVDVVRQRAVAIEARLARDVLIHGRDSDGLREVARGERVAVPYPVDRLDRVLANEAIVRRVTIVARGNRVVGTTIPPVELLPHDVAVDACCRIVGQVRHPRGIVDGKEAEADDAAEQGRQSHEHP